MPPLPSWCGGIAARMEGLNARVLAGREAGLSAPSGLCFWRGGILVADMDNRRVVWMKPDGGIVPLDGNAPPLEKPLALAADETCVWVADAVQKALWRWQAGEWRKLASPAALSPALTLPGGVALSDRGELYFTDFLTNRICRRTPCGEYSVIKGIDCEKPYGLCLQGDEVYLTDNARGRILCYSQAREKYDVLFERGEGWSPIALAASSDGWLYISTGRTLSRLSLSLGRWEPVVDALAWRELGLGKLCHLGAIAAKPGRIVVSDTIRSNVVELILAQ